MNDIRAMWAYPFMVSAFRAGAIVAVVAGVMGWFMVLRRQTFAGHTLALSAFPGAAGATLIGVAASYGYFAFCTGAAAVIALATRGARAGAVAGGVAGAGAGAGRAGHAASAQSRVSESALTGIVQAAVLACGLLFVALYHGFLNGTTALLFGSFLGITTSQVILLGVTAAGVLAALAALGRPLLFASVDPDVAAARGVPVRALSVTFLVLLGVAVAETAQITGALLVFALLVMPAAAAQRLTARPAAGLLLTVIIGFAVTWAGLTAAFYSPYPIGFWVTSFAFAVYLAAQAAPALLRYRRARKPAAARPGATGAAGPAGAAGAAGAAV